MCILYNAGQGQITGNSWCSWSSDLETGVVPGVPPVRRVTDHGTDVRHRTSLVKCVSRNQCLAPHVPFTGAGAWIPVPGNAPVSVSGNLSAWRKSLFCACYRYPVCVLSRGTLSFSHHMKSSIHSRQVPRPTTDESPNNEQTNKIAP